MNSTAILAFVVAPAFVVALGWAAVLWHDRSLTREFGPLPRAKGDPASGEGP